jgi:hypothetical protein
LVLQSLKISLKTQQVERNELTELQQFTQDLNAQLLNSVSRFIYNSWEPEYRWELHFGSLSIEVYPSSGGLTTYLDTNRRANTSNHPNNMRLYSYFIILLFLYYFWLWSYYNQPTGIEKVKVVSTPATTLKD